MVDFDPARGSEQAGMRPAAIISNDRQNQHSPVVIVAAITSQQVERRARLPICVFIPRGELREDSIVLASQLLTLSKDRLKRYYGALTDEQLVELDRALLVSLALPRL